MCNLFEDPRGNPMQFINSSLSEWDGDIGQSEAFFSGFFAAMKIYGLPCPIDPNANILEANAWVARQILAAEVKHRDNELSKARKIIAALKFDKATAQDFLLRADFQGGTDSCKSSIIYTSDDGTVFSYNSYHNPSPDLVDSDFLATLWPVRFLTTSLGTTAIAIRSDDYPMMAALIESLLKSGDSDFQAQLLEQVNREPESGCLDLRPYTDVVTAATTQQK